MTMEEGMDAGFDLDLAAATLRANLSDVHIMLKVLAAQLADTLGDRLVVERGGSRFERSKFKRSKSDEVRGVKITLGGDDYQADVDGSTLRCTISHSSGGIRIRSEQVDMDTWIARLLGALQAEAAHSETARQALQNIVIGGSQ
ncbi:MAG: hypothetical protein ACYCV5_06515 [Acidimicrobiales bacterium]|jgi:hypothetical protein